MRPRAKWLIVILWIEDGVKRARYAFGATEFEAAEKLLVDDEIKRVAGDPLLHAEVETWLVPADFS